MASLCQVANLVAPSIDPYFLWLRCANVQVACFADLHVRVVKRPAEAAGGDGRVTTSFEALLSPQERIEEVAAMLGEIHTRRVLLSTPCRQAL